MLMVCSCFQIQSDTSPCMTTNTFGISRGIQKGKMWFGDRTGEMEMMIVVSLSTVTLGSLWFRFVEPFMAIISLCMTVGVGVAPFTFFLSVLQSGCSFNVSSG